MFGYPVPAFREWFLSKKCNRRSDHLDPWSCGVTRFPQVDGSPGKRCPPGGSWRQGRRRISSEGAGLEAQSEPEARQVAGPAIPSGYGTVGTNTQRHASPVHGCGTKLPVRPQLLDGMRFAPRAAVWARPMANRASKKNTSGTLGPDALSGCNSPTGAMNNRSMP